MRAGSARMRVLAAVAVSAAVAVPTVLAAPPVWASIPALACATLAIAAAVAVVRRTAGKTRVTFTLVLAGIATLAVDDALWLGNAAGGVPLGTIAAAEPWLLGAGYLLVLGAGARALGPTLRRDTGTVVDAVTFALAFTSALWQAVLAPALHQAGVGRGDRLSVLTIAVLLGGSVGIILGTTASRAVERSARTSQVYLLASLAFAVAGNASAVAASDPVSGATPAWVDIWWPLSYLAAWGALRDPSITHAFTTTRPDTSRLSSRRLAALGAAMMLTPIIAAGRELAGEYVDWTAFATFHLLIIAGVFRRTAQIAAAHRETEARLRTRAHEDALTGLANRRAAERHLTELSERVRAGTSPGMVVCFIDLDGFKPINDRLGHAAGDELLAQVAGRLRSRTRSGSSDLVARIGGDEFLVIASGDPEEVEDPLVSRIQDVFVEPFALDAGIVSASASLGVATARAGTDHTLDELLSDADHRMYAVKQARRDASAP